MAHNEADRLPYPLGLAFEAAGPRDRVWFVDSASTDDSAAVAAKLGAEVVSAPIGKGRAVARAIDLCQEGYLCLIDGDLEPSGANFPALLKEAVLRERPGMAIGESRQRGRRRSVIPYVYRPLLGALFPEALDLFGDAPLSGFRALDMDVQLGRIPPGYGLEAHLNVMVSLSGRQTTVVPLPQCNGPLRGYANAAPAALDVAEAILDLAVERGRLDSRARPLWDSWVADVADVIAAQPPPGAPGEEFLATVAELGTRPLPPTRLQAQAG